MAFGRAARLARELDRWIEQGWVPAKHRDSILADAAARGAAWTSTGALAVMGASLLALAAIAFVASNWQAIAPLERFTVILAALWAAFLGAGRAFDRGAPTIGHGLALIGAALFGAAIMLTAQTFNLSAFRNTGLLIWAIGALGVAVFTPSRPVMILAAGLGGWWAAAETQNAFAPDIIWGYLLLWAASMAAAARLRSTVSAHLLSLALFIWIAWALLDQAGDILLSPLQAASSFALIAAAIALAASAARERGLFGFGVLSGWGAALAVWGGSALQWPLENFADSARRALGDPNSSFDPAERWAELFMQSSPLYSLLAVTALIVIAVALMARMAAGGTRWMDSLALMAGALFAAALPVVLPALGPEAIDAMRILAGIAVYGVAIALILRGAREEQRIIGAIGVIAFIGQSAYVYGTTFGGGLLDTALFFLVAGVALFALAALSGRFRNRGEDAPIPDDAPLPAPPAEGEAVALEADAEDGVLAPAETEAAESLAGAAAEAEAPDTPDNEDAPEAGTDTGAGDGAEDPPDDTTADEPGEAPDARTEGDAS
jgi:uncharacterized membrane protein